MPSDYVKIKINVCNKSIIFEYRNNKCGNRSFKVNDYEVKGEFDELMNTEKIVISKNNLTDGMTIMVTD